MRNIYSTIAWYVQLYKDINPWVKAVLTLSTEITALDQPTTFSSDVSKHQLLRVHPLRVMDRSADYKNVKCN